jgi:GNAT superfamily N-acetyltransferase
VRRRLPDDIELDDDPERIDLAAVHAYLNGEAYWVSVRSLQDVALSVSGAARVLGAYDREAQVGFARVVSDRLTVAYIDDLYVLGPYRGRGIGTAIMDELLRGEPWAGLNWILFTADAHSFYERFGFGTPPGYVMMRPHASDKSDESDNV